LLRKYLGKILALKLITYPTDFDDLLPQFFFRKTRKKVFATNKKTAAKFAAVF
jgi:hypothetical protein